MSEVGKDRGCWASHSECREFTTNLQAGLFLYMVGTTARVWIWTRPLTRRALTTLLQRGRKDSALPTGRSCLPRQVRLVEVDGVVLSDGVNVTSARSHHRGDMVMDLGLDDTDEVPGQTADVLSGTAASEMPVPIS